MTRRAGKTPLYDLIAPSIRDDPTIKAAAAALDPSRYALAKSPPSLLLWARLDPAFTALHRLAPPLQRLADLAGGVKPLSEAELELLAWQLHVDFRETAKTPEQLAGMVLRSIPWHRIKGTPASIRDALALFGLQAEIEEDGTGDYWATYQIGLPQIADEETVKLVCRIAYEMQPARCSLYRIYTDVWDVRPGTYSDGRYSEAAYSYYSGVPVPGLPDGGDIIVSFGRRHASQSCERLGDMYTGLFRLGGVLATQEDDFLYSTAAYSETMQTPGHGFVRFRLHSIVVGKVRYKRHHWTGLWDSRRWEELESVETERAPVQIKHGTIARIEGVYSESAYGDLNTFYGQPVHVLVDDPAVYSESAYSDHDPKRRTVLVDELFWNARTSHAAGNLLEPSASAASARAGTRQAHTEPLLRPLRHWSGLWNSRPWTTARAFSRLIHEERAARTEPFITLPRWSGLWDERIWRPGQAFTQLTREENV